MKADGLMPENTTLRSSKYLNNVIEQDHRNIKSRVAVMLTIPPRALPCRTQCAEKLALRMA
jgi:transposase-like protein